VDAAPPVGPSLSTYLSVADTSGLASVTLTLGSLAPHVVKVWAAVTDGTAHTAGVTFTATTNP
jgi:hypothetical protein